MLLSLSSAPYTAVDMWHRLPQVRIDDSFVAGSSATAFSSSQASATLHEDRDLIELDKSDKLCLVAGDDGDQRIKARQVRFVPRPSISSHFSLSRAHAAQLAGVTSASQDTPGEACVGRDGSVSDCR